MVVFNLFTIELADLFNIKILVGRRRPLKSLPHQFLSGNHHQGVKLGNPYGREIGRVRALSGIDLSLPIDFILGCLSGALTFLPLTLEKDID